MNPKSWLSRYRGTSISYLTTMLLFYHGIGLLLMLIGSSVADKVISDYKEPSIPLSLTSVLSAGPIEETIFYGIPFYVFGNNLVVLAGGIAWAMIHILNTNTPSFSNLAYANWLFVVPSLFFSLRTWISGKGWFAILTHSAWNGIFFMLGCAFGETSCVNISSEKIFAVSIGSIILSGTLLSLTYLLYKRHHDKETQRLAT